MRIDWPRAFNDQLDRLEADVSERGQRRLELLTFMLKRLRDLEAPPVQDTATMGDVFYDTVGIRADHLINRWIDETKEA